MCSLFKPTLFKFLALQKNARYTELKFYTSANIYITYIYLVRKTIKQMFIIVFLSEQCCPNAFFDLLMLNFCRQKKEREQAISDMKQQHDEKIDELTELSKKKLIEAEQQHSDGNMLR